MIFQTREKEGMGELVAPGGMDILWINNLLAVADPAEGFGLPPPIRPDACLRLKFLNRQDCVSLFNWLIFSLMKQALHFASKLNSRDIPKCNLLILGTLL